MTRPAFDPSIFGGNPSIPPVPMVVCWDDLEPDAYARRLDELGEWICWFRATYRVPATVVPPCWFLHPGIREDIGHLWTGWLLTRHPDAGVGMIGLEWDHRRELAVIRLREATAVTGCTAGRHQPEPEAPAPGGPSIDDLWRGHLDQSMQQRLRAVAVEAVTDQVVEGLQAAELRHELAPALLAEITADPANATDDDRVAVAAQLQDIAAQAITTAVRSATDAARATADAQQHTLRESRVADARGEIAQSIAMSAISRGGRDPQPDSALRDAWLTALEALLPARIAADRAAAAASARASTVDQRAARRHQPDIDGLLA